MDEIEGLGTFYLGKPYDLAAKAKGDGYVLYDSTDLTTHGVCVGMTGSGKTGLCIGLIEEAALDGIPSIIIDPKGDLGNLALRFPNLQPADFRPWVNEEDAAKAGVSVDDYAVKQAELWTKGIADWGQDGARIQRLCDAADVRIYTPGSDAGLQVSVLGSFAPPPDMSDGEAVRDGVSSIATGLCGLMGIEADPISSREHILISNIIANAWSGGQALDITALIGLIQSPPFSKVGALDLDQFYPEKDRGKLAVQLNNLLAAPGFDLWLQGSPLDIGHFLRSDAGKPQVTIFSIAHLGDTERMFFVTLLMNAVLGWMRGQSGTSSLRALLYMDEIFGYFPPNGEPSSKKPLLTLLKQGRAFGLGVLLATQNPVDLDYKGLSNCGTWLIGRLQTDQDKQRLLDGLEGAASGSGFQRSDLEKILSGLGARVFLLNNVHKNQPTVFQTRWTLSYLRGPITGTQIKTLMAPVKASMPAAAPVAAHAAVTVTGAAATSAPTAPKGIPATYLPLRGAAPAGSSLVYVPMLLGSGKVRLLDAKTGIDQTTENTRLTAFAAGPVPIDWNAGSDASVPVGDMESEPRAGAAFDDLPAAARDAKAITAFSRDYADWLYQTQELSLLHSAARKAFSKPDESESDFRARIAQAASSGQDAKAVALGKAYEGKKATLEERLRKSGQAVDREKDQSKQAGLNAMLNIGTSILGGFFGRKSSSASSIKRAASGASRAMGQHGDVGRAEDTVKAVQQQLDDLTARYQADLAAATGAGGTPEVLETVVVRPKKTDIDVTLVALAFAPHWQDANGTTTPAWG